MCALNMFLTCKDTSNSFGAKWFILKTVILLTLICVPGNIITITLIYKHWPIHADLKSEHNATNRIKESENTLLSEDEATPTVSST